jgi:hypothetical protein
MNNNPILIFRSNSGKTMIFTYLKKRKIFNFIKLLNKSYWNYQVKYSVRMINNILNCILHINYNTFVNLQYKRHIHFYVWV